MSRWSRFRRLSALDRTSLVEALVLLPVTGSALLLVGLRRWQGILSAMAPHRKSPAVNLSRELAAAKLESAQRVARMVAAASREGLYHGQCLPQSVVLWWLLLWRREPAELHIGVRQVDAKFEAHAWVELFGCVVNDADGVRRDYVAFGRNIASLGIEQR